MLDSDKHDICSTPCSHLLRASRLHPSLDVDFMIFTARQAADSSSSAGSRLNALSRVAFEKHLTDARKFVLGAMKAQSSFWESLVAPQPNMGASE